MGRQEREYIVEEISNQVKENPNLIVSSFINIKADRLNELRSKLAEKSGGYFVVKNTLCHLALDKANMSELKDFVDGPTGFVFCGENPVDISKILVDFSKEEEGFALKGGYIDGLVLDETSVKKLAALPSKKELLTMMVCGVKSPITSFVGVLSNLIKGLVVVLNEASKKMEQTDQQADEQPGQPADQQADEKPAEKKDEEVNEDVNKETGGKTQEEAKRQAEQENKEQTDKQISEEKEEDKNQETGK